MSKYRKKPVTVEAEQFFLDKKWPEGVVKRLRREIPFYCPEDPDDWVVVIETFEGWHIVSENDWIITGIKGEKYPCKPDIFKATYELVVNGDEFRNEDGIPELVLDSE